ncbi:ArsR family transcriptional regulator [Bacillus salacetis]|uniref:ArsR family transcriptional regulator n=1 Tax=Bacillus salacetis TaxID=2315464 RepID=A0A3A1QT64_9BACI|nr:metalloregulator ArsR/SmtB family transcription factor [Bacillus salacetis]RIW30418.1 ArsR family transcriptional regulator [Bacillus salacetis]
MKRLTGQAPVESISLEVQWSPIWEVILGIAGYTHRELRHTFEMDATWLAAADDMPKSLVTLLEEIEKTNFWYGMIMLQNEFEAQSVQEFSNKLAALSPSSFYEILLPYKGRDYESLRKDAAAENAKQELFQDYAAIFDNHEYFGGYVEKLGQYSQKEMSDLVVSTIKGWHSWISQQGCWKKWVRALEFEGQQNRSLDFSKPFEEIDRVTGGVKYLPEPSVWTVKMIPHVSYRPWLLENRTFDTKLFFYPIKDAFLTEPGEPPAELVRGHKALGDELRLKILYHLLKGPLSLQDISMHFKTSKTRLHHQLSLLKAARFVSVEKGIYSVNPEQVQSFSEKLTHFLDVKE